MTLEGQKMAKSKGNFISLGEMFSGAHPLLDKAYSPVAVRFLMLQAHYGSTIDFSNQALRSAETACKKLLNGLHILYALPATTEGKVDEALSSRILQVCEDCYLRMNDDFNTAETIACLFELHGMAQKISDGQNQITVSEEAFAGLKKTYPAFLTEVLGILPENDAENSFLPGVMDILLDIREEAREEKNFALSDRIRDQLAALGLTFRMVPMGQNIGQNHD